MSTKIDPKLMPDDEATTIEGEPEQPAKRTRAPRQPRAGEKKLESAVSKTAIQHALYRIFATVAKFPFRSTATFSEDEFSEAASDLEMLVNKLPPVKIFFNVIAPLIAVLGLADKVQRIREQARPKPGEPMYPPGNNSTEGVHV